MMDTHINRAVERQLAAEFAPPKVVIRNLSVLAYAQGFTLWHYRADAAGLDRVAERGFFNDAADMFSAGDMVLVSGAEGGRVLFVTAAEHDVVTAPLAGSAAR